MLFKFHPWVLSSSNLPDQGVLWFMTHQSSKKKKKKTLKIWNYFFIVHQFGAFALPVRRRLGTYCGASSLLVLMQDLIHIASAVARSVCQWLDATLFVMVFIFRSSAWWPVNTWSPEESLKDISRFRRSALEDASVHRNPDYWYSDEIR